MRRAKNTTDDLQGESDGSQPSDTLTGDGEVSNDFWTMAGTIFVVLTLNQKLNFLCAE